MKAQQQQSPFVYVFTLSVLLTITNAATASAHDPYFLNDALGT